VSGGGSGFAGCRRGGGCGALGEVDELGDLLEGVAERVVVDLFGTDFDAFEEGLV